MPNLEVLKEFKSLIDDLGDERSILSRSGQAIYDLSPKDFPELDKKPPAPVTSAQETDSPTNESSPIADEYTEEESADAAIDNISDIPNMENLFDDTELTASEPQEADRFDIDETTQSVAESDASAPLADTISAPNPSDEASTDMVEESINLSIDDEKPNEDIDKFSLDDFGEDYKLDASALSGPNTDEELKKLEVKIDKAVKEEIQKFSITDNEVEIIKETLATLPLNMKLAIEELLANAEWSFNIVQPLIDGLLYGENIRQLAGRYYRITKKRIKLPVRYKRMSGKALEEYRTSLLYRISTETWPLLRNFLVILTIAWLCVMVLFNWIYRPLKAASLYSKGMKAIMQDDVKEANSYFQDAYNGWPLFQSRSNDDRIYEAGVVVKGVKLPSMWLEYARQFRRRKHWDIASQFYEGALIEKPKTKKVRLEYADFLSGIMGNYERAITVLDERPISGRNTWDQDFVLAKGDVYLDWAEDDPKRYEDARLQYAKALEHSRDNEIALLSMMRYHLKLDNHEEIALLLPVFNKENSKNYSRPVLAAQVFAGLAEYHLSRGDTREAFRFIKMGKTADPTSPEPFFVSASYWRLKGDVNLQLENYQKTLVNIASQETANHNLLKMRILSLGGIGRIYALLAVSLPFNSEERENDSRIALRNYNKALDIYNDARSRNQLGSAPEYGALYAAIGDFLFYSSDKDGHLMFTLSQEGQEDIENEQRSDELHRIEEYYNQAEQLFDRGERTSALPVDNLYRRGYIRYLLNTKGSLEDFYRVTRERPDDYEARISLATALLAAGDFEASRNQYSRALELLDDIKENAKSFNPSSSEQHQELLLRYIMVWNNLGVALARAGRRSGEESSYASAMNAFTTASDYIDQVRSDMPGLLSRGIPLLRGEENQRIVDRENQRNNLKEKKTFPYQNRMKLIELADPQETGEGYLYYKDIPSQLIRHQ